MALSFDFDGTGLLLLIAACTLAYIWFTRRDGRVSNGTRELATFEDVPGPADPDPEFGHMGEVGGKGGLHLFMLENVRKYGNIFRFMWMKTPVVVIADPKMWSEGSRMFDRPEELFALFKPLIGEQSIQYANGELGKKHRRYFTSALSHRVVTSLDKVYQQVGHKVLDTLGACAKSGSSFDLNAAMEQVSMRAIILIAFGLSFEDEDKLERISKAYHKCWGEMEVRMSGSFPEPGSQRQTEFDNARGYIHQCVKDILREGNSQQDNDNPTFLQRLRHDDASADLDEDGICDEATTMLIGGMHTTGNLLNWAIIYLAQHPSIQDKLRKECAGVFGKGQVPSANELDQLPYLNMVIKETLRLSVLAPWGARFSSKEASIGGYAIPAETPIIHAFGCVLVDPKVWGPDVADFKPERFSEENKKSIPSLAFSPYGFGGKRVCPGIHLANTEGALFIGAMVRQFEFRLVKGQVIKPEHGLVSTPDRVVKVLVSEVAK